jgi:hypothetical protein
MTRFAIPSIAFVLLLWVAPASAHGCHHGRQHTAKEGWHIHGTQCELRHGIRGKHKAARQAADTVTGNLICSGALCGEIHKPQ